jgi:hypothetical protein
MSRRARLGFLAACLLAFALIAALTTWGPPSTGPSTKTPATVTLAPGVTRPAGLAVTELRDANQLQARFNDDQGAPRLTLVSVAHGFLILERLRPNLVASA